MQTYKPLREEVALCTVIERVTGWPNVRVEWSRCPYCDAVVFFSYRLCDSALPQSEVCMMRCLQCRAAWMWSRLKWL